MKSIRKKMMKIIFLAFITMLSENFANAGVSHVQICANLCIAEVCKKIMDEIEFELEISKDILIIDCNPRKPLALKDEFRLTLSEERKGEFVKVIFECGPQTNCLTKKYNAKAAIGFIITNDFKIAMRKHQGKQNSEYPKKEKKEQVARIQKPKAETSPLIESVEKPFREPEPLTNSQEKVLEEWDRVVLMDKKAVIDTPHPIDGLNLGHVTISFGGENWNYFFDSIEHPDRVSPIHARVYPRTMFSTTIWGAKYLRFSLDMAASFMNFRLRANQPVDGDGQIVAGQAYHSQAMISLLIPLLGVLHLGGDLGYEFNGSFIGPHFLDEKSVTIVPGYQSHALRVGPRFVVGANSKKGMIDVSTGFYPFMNYFETPDEPTVSKEMFAFSADAIIRMMLSKEIFADVSLRMLAFYITYANEAQRQTVEGENWGPGVVWSNVASATIGLGYLF